MNRLETHVLDIIGENSDSPDVFVEGSDEFDQIRGSLNDAIQEIAIITGSKKRVLNIPLKANKFFYRIELETDEFAWITSVWLYNLKRRLSQKGFFWLTQYNPRWLYNVGTPERYVQIGEKTLCIHPAPSAATDILEVTCVIAPERYTRDTDRINLRKEWEWGAVHYAVGEYWASRGDVQTAVTHHKTYLKHLGMSEAYPEFADKRWGLNTFKNPEPQSAWSRNR